VCVFSLWLASSANLPHTHQTSTLLRFVWISVFLLLAPCLLGIAAHGIRLKCTPMCAAIVRSIAHTTLTMLTMLSFVTGMSRPDVGAQHSNNDTVLELIDFKHMDAVTYGIRIIGEHTARVRRHAPTNEEGPKAQALTVSDAIQQVGLDRVPSLDGSVLGVQADQIATALDDIIVSPAPVYDRKFVRRIRLESRQIGGSSLGSSLTHAAPPGRRKSRRKDLLSMRGTASASDSSSSQSRQGKVRRRK
jgi:hypothetical protein